MRPPHALIEFGLVEPGTVWRAHTASYGLRVGPRAWGRERNAELNKMVIKHAGRDRYFQPSHVDPIRAVDTPRARWV